MRSEQIVGWLLCGLLATAFANISRSVGPAAPPSRSGGTQLAAIRGQRAETTADSVTTDPLSQVRRVALLIPETSKDALVVRVVAAEHANHARRRRPGLFAPKPTETGRKPASPIRKPVDKKAPPSTAPDNETEYSPAQLRSIAETLFWDSLADRLDNHIAAQVVPQTDLLAALAELKLSRSALLSRAQVAALCAKLNCEAILLPSACRIRTREADVRALSLWSSIRVVRAVGRQSAANSSGRLERPVDFPVAGASYSEHAPFSDHFFKDWPQIASEAARQAADVAGRTLETGVAAPFVNESDRVAIAPVAAPTHADALMFHMGGRTVEPAALRAMPADVSSYFRPDMLPLFPDRIVSAKTAADAVSAEHASDENLWTANEMPDSVRVVALGKRLKVKYVLMARVPDLEIAVTTVPASVAGSSPRDLRPDADAQESATAEAIGALVRVSDGAVLWNARTTATMSGGVRANETPAASRRRIARDAVRFSLVQLDRRFRQYRHRFE